MFFAPVYGRMKENERRNGKMISEYSNKKPAVADGCFVAENATVVGDVTMEAGASVWFGAVIRGDMDSVTIGKNSNIQENATVHVSPGHPAVIGHGVTVGHGAVVHGANIGDNVLVGMNAVVLDGAVIGKNSIIGAGAVVTAGTVIPENTLMLGVPAVAAKKVSPASAASNTVNALAYVKLAKQYEKQQKQRIRN